MLAEWSVRHEVKDFLVYVIRPMHKVGCIASRWLVTHYIVAYTAGLFKFDLNFIETCSTCIPFAQRNINAKIKIARHMHNY